MGTHTIFSSLPQNTTAPDVQSELPKKYPTTTQADFDISSVALLGEDESRRTESTKTFQRADGSFVVALYADAVHYQNDGKWGKY
ncbi:MAG: hypothetical protein MZU97_14115 [Bacillus subtilis]|nr:hypothetical protein [Bacillus subtilis]